MRDSIGTPFEKAGATDRPTDRPESNAYKLTVTNMTVTSMTATNMPVTNMTATNMTATDILLREIVAKAVLGEKRRKYRKSGGGGEAKKSK